MRTPSASGRGRHDRGRPGGIRWLVRRGRGRHRLGLGALLVVAGAAGCGSHTQGAAHVSLAVSVLRAGGRPARDRRAWSARSSARGPACPLDRVRRSSVDIEHPAARQRIGDRPVARPGRRARAVGDEPGRPGVRESVLLPARQRADRARDLADRQRQDRRPRDPSATHHAALGARQEADQGPRRDRRSAVHAARAHAPAGCGRVRRLRGRQLDDRRRWDARGARLSGARARLFRGAWPAQGTGRHPAGVLRAGGPRAGPHTARGSCPHQRRWATRAAASWPCCSPPPSRTSSTEPSGSSPAIPSIRLSAANLRAWTLHGRPLPLEEIPVERIRRPGAHRRRGRRSRLGLERKRQTDRASTGRSALRLPHQGLVYEHAGHLIGDPLPYQPTTGPASGFGGTPRADAAADADLWPRILSFFADRLGS